MIRKSAISTVEINPYCRSYIDHVFFKVNNFVDNILFSFSNCVLSNMLNKKKQKKKMEKKEKIEKKKLSIQDI